MFDLGCDGAEEASREVGHVWVAGSASFPCDRGGYPTGSCGGDLVGGVGVDVVVDAAGDLEEVS
jgi:hypothetical protein